MNIWDVILGVIPGAPKGADPDVVFIPVKVEEIPEPMAEALATASGKEFHMTVSTNELAAMYALKDWRIAQSAEGDRAPTARELLTLMLNLATTLEAPGQCLSLGRIMAFSDPEFPGSTDFFLHIGHMHTDDETELEGVDVDSLEPRV